MEGIPSLKDILQHKNYMGKIDLQDAYLTVPVDRKHRNYLKFHWKGKNYRYQSLPFGLATALSLHKDSTPLGSKDEEIGYPSYLLPR